MDVDCLYCDKKFTVSKVKDNKLILFKRDSDLCFHYEKVNPLLYSTYLCTHCGYAFNDSFRKLVEPYRSIVKKEYIEKINIPNISKDRTVEDGLRVLKLSYLTAKISKDRQVVLADISMKIAWIYRFEKDQENEERWLKTALDCFNSTLSSEGQYLESLDEDKVFYMIAELNSRLGNYIEARRHFSHLITGRGVSSKFKKMAVDRWESYREEIAEIEAEEKQKALAELNEAFLEVEFKPELKEKFSILSKLFK